MLQITINVSVGFEPGMQTIGDFVADAAKQLEALAAKLNSEPDLDVSDELVKEMELNLLSVEGEY